MSSDLKFYRRLVIINGFLPLLILGWDAWRGQLGANSVNQALHITGILSLVFLFLSLVVTPLRALTGWNSLIAYRRSLGLFGFMYAVIHLAIYVGLDRALSFSSTVEELFSRRFLQVGGISLLLMVPLALTSTNGMIQRIGPRRWKQLHRLAYIAVALGVVHYYMLVKSDVRQPLAFAAVLTPLLGFRVYHRYKDRKDSVNRKTLATPTKNGGTPKPKFWKGKLKVVKIFRETHNVQTFRFQSIEDGDLPFRHQAGQYLNIQLPIDGKMVRRSYTISSSPTANSYCEITVKREDQGLGSRYLHDHVREGTILDISAPAGRFVFDDHEHTAVTLIAGGVGITPMMSMARSLTERSWPGQIYFLFVARTPADIIFRDELQKMEARYTNFRLHITLTEKTLTEKTLTVTTQSGEPWTGACGRLTEITLKEIVPTITQHPAFVCGPNAMMDATCELLRRVGVPDKWIHTEAFVSPTGVAGDANEAAIASNDAGAIAESVIHFTKSKIVTTASSEVTILEAAEAAGVDMTWECRSGICGQCKVHCSEGAVHMASHDALSPSEKAKGYILACQAVARSAELRIDA